MGVPSFFAWLVRKYESDILFETDPCRLEQAVDVIYLDLNCAIHPAVKERPMTREEMFPAIWEYLLGIVAAAAPQRMVYIAIDGVAPMAKMRQQRLRRYKSVQDRLFTDRLKRKYHRPVDAGQDFNMISPGTVFMADLSRYLRARLATAQEANGPFSALEVIFSDADEIGEGEHKIMHHLRSLDPAWRAVVYGLDSDLIFLTLVNYRKGMCLVRERQLMREQKEVIQTSATSQRPYDFLSIGALRSRLLYILNPGFTLSDLFKMGFPDRYMTEGLFAPYRDRVMNTAAGGASAYYRASNGSAASPIGDEQRLILDYVIICFLLGNDFIPHLPSLKIKEGGLDQLIIAYKLVGTVRQEFLYQSDAGRGTINIAFLKALLEALAAVEDSFLTEQTRARQHRLTRRPPHDGPPTYESELEDYQNVESGVDPVVMGTAGWRERYYRLVFGMRDGCPSPGEAVPEEHPLTGVVVEYLKGMRWTLTYYTAPETVSANDAAWWWHYPFDYAPSVSHMVGVLRGWSQEKLTALQAVPSVSLPRGLKASPAFQLLCILPPQSVELLPAPLQTLMTEPTSGLIHLYPIQTGVHTFHKRLRWECHPVLPPLDLGLMWRVFSTRMPS